MSSHGSNGHHNRCNGDTVILTFNTTTNQIVFYDESVTTGCPTGGRFVVANACLLSNGFRVVFSEGTGTNEVTFVYVRC